MGLPDCDDLRRERAPGAPDQTCAFDGTRGFISAVKCDGCGFDVYRYEGPARVCMWCGRAWPV
jgi:hypothetical protein